MLSLELSDPGRTPVFMFLGAHCDDIEIGCGGTVRSLVRRYPSGRFIWVTFSSDEEREKETRDAAQRLLAGAAQASVFVERFEGSYFPMRFADIKGYFEGLKHFRPDLILTHYRADLHQDHRVVNELTWNTFRDHQILEYEIPKFDGDLGVPNVFVPLSRQDLDDKCRMLLECFPSQHARRWFTKETFEAVARIRGIECNAREGYAEAFYGRKLSLDI